MIKPVKFFKGGIKPPHRKNTFNMETVEMPVPEKINIPMLQHIGKECYPTVKKGDKVLVGQKIGDSDSFISSPVHSSVSGIVTNIKPMLYSGGFDVVSVEIKTDGEQLPYKVDIPNRTLGNMELLKLIKESGIVGLGGAGFPTFVKLSPVKNKKLDTLVVNAAECEPYITSDYREMIENPKAIVEGIKIVMELTQVRKVLIGIESNKPKAIQILSDLVKSDENISVVSLKTRYPQGGEKQLIYAVTGRKVSTGGLPIDVGVLVQNINTLSFLDSYIKTGMPLISKKVTVAGNAISNPMNLKVLIGTSLQDVFDYCGGFKENPTKIIMGGPMMGVSQFSLENTVIKQTNALLALTKNEVSIDKESVCIRCGKCVDVCPMNLLPLYININVEKGLIEDTSKYNINDCIECGCCSYICPASRNLVQSIRYAKAEMRKIKK
ncbi:MAG: electron transport complex subunit RsxC [Clostridiales bacterium]